MSEVGVIHIYGQDAEHDDAYITGDETALRKLRDAIDQALSDACGSQGKANVSSSDGEPYSVYVVNHADARSRCEERYDSFRKAFLPLESDENYVWIGKQ